MTTVAGEQIGVLVSGAGTNLRALVAAGLPVVAVASNRSAAPALAFAAERGLAARAFARADHPSRAARDAAMAGWLTGEGVSLVVCAGYMALLDPAFLAAFGGRVVNVHPSLLPAFPGASPIEDALAAGVARTGVTVHVLDEGVDSGPVLAQEAVDVRPTDTAEALRMRVHAVEHRLLPATVAAIVRGELALDGTATGAVHDIDRRRRPL